MHTPAIAVALAVALGLAAPTAWSQTAADVLTVSDLHVRAVPPVVPNSAAFMTLHNRGDIAHTLIGASSPAAATVELHTHIDDNGVMRMRPVEGGIAVAPGATVRLAPGGLHVMLIGLHRPLNEGDTVSLELQFADGSRRTLAAPVQQIATGGGHHHHH